MKILVKFPTRQRPKKFFETLNQYQKTRTTDLVHFLITIDGDDATMNNRTVINTLTQWGNLSYEIVRPNGKISAINHGIKEISQNYDIIVVASDDMIPIVKGWDQRIIDDMTTYYPDTDGVLWYNDGFTGRKLNTLCILGTKYFRRFGYVYHPAYRSLWCDNEFMEVADHLGKQTYFEDVIIRHEHPINGYGTNDGLNNRDNRLYNLDKSTYDQRKEKGFGLTIDTHTDVTGKGAASKPTALADQPPAGKPKRKRKGADLHPVGQPGDVDRAEA